VDRTRHKECGVLSGVRRRGLSGGKSLVYLEWSPAGSEEATPEQRDRMRTDPTVWAESNPALGIRIDPEFVERELAALDAQSFDVERLSIGDWPPDNDGSWPVIPETRWTQLATAEGRPDPATVVFGVACAWPDADRTSISVAGSLGGAYLVQVIEHRVGTSWVPARLAELVDAHSPAAVVVDAGGPAGQLLPLLADAGIEVVSPSMREVAAGYGMYHSAVMGETPTLKHYGQAVLDRAVAGADRRPLSDGWVWARQGVVDISPLESVTLALWGHVVHGTPVDVLGTLW
jgi:hypothetical protein